MAVSTFTLQAKKEQPIEALITGHVLLGIVSAFVPFAAVVYILSFFAYSLSVIIQTNNRNNYAAFAALYCTSYEMLFRMSRVLVIYEFGKYAVVMLLLVGMLVEKEKRAIPRAALIYFLLLLPSIAAAKYSSFAEARKLVSFNLSGPFSLTVSWIYFHNKKINKHDFKKLIVNIALPVIAVLPFIVLKIPKLSGGVFFTESTKDFSGGFGPNQVSSILGFGFFAIALSLLLNVKVTISRTLDIIISMVFLTFAALTFSRGGVISGILALMASVYVFVRSGFGSRQFSRVFFGLVVFGFAGYMVWQLLNSFTHHSITDRYVATVQAKAGTSQIDLSGRVEIATRDFSAFIKHPILGNGPGGAGLLYADKALGLKGITASHTEFSRLMGDHGLLGIIAMISLLSGFYTLFKNRKGYQKVVMIGFAVISFSTMMHADMRLAMVGVAFGLSTALFDLEEHSLQRTS